MPPLVDRRATYPCSGRISAEADTPAPEKLTEARWIDLTRTAGSEGATRLAGAVTALVAPQLDRQRPLGAKGLATLRSDVAAILAGLLRAAFKGRPVSAHRRPGAALWQHSPIGQHAFWSRVEGLHHAGLLNTVKGIQHVDSTFAGHAFKGLPGRLWATPQLLAMAAEHGVTADTSAMDWPVSRAAETRRTVLPRAGLVVTRDRDGGPVGIRADQQDMAAAMRAGVERLNERARAADIRGCLAPLFRRSFGPDLRLGGRCYSVGSGFQAMPPHERETIRIDCEATAEVDIHAALLTIFLALAGRTVLPEGDLYAISDIPRAVIKAAVVQTFGAGRLLQRWSPRAPAECRAVPPSMVRGAMLAHYPELAEIQAILPADLRTRFIANVDWCAGQFLVGVEASVITDAVAQVMAEGHVALPMHDAIICKAGSADMARDAITRAFRDRLGVSPRIALAVPSVPSIARL